MNPKTPKPQNPIVLGEVRFEEFFNSLISWRKAGLFTFNTFDFYAFIRLQVGLATHSNAVGIHPRQVLLLQKC